MNSRLKLDLTQQPGDGFSGVTDIFLEAESSSLALTSFIMIINVPKCKQLDLKLDRVLIKYVVEG